MRVAIDESGHDQGIAVVNNIDIGVPTAHFRGLADLNDQSIADQHTAMAFVLAVGAGVMGTRMSHKG